MSGLLPSASVSAVLPLAIPGVWRGERLREAVPTQSTGSRPLDEILLG